MKNWKFIVLLFVLGCEKIVLIDLPPSQNLVVVEGWLTDQVIHQSVRIIKSNGFLEEQPVQPITNANIIVERRNGGFQIYRHVENGYYLSETPFAGNQNSEYRINISIEDSIVLVSDWDRMQKKTEIEFITVKSYEENDVENPGEQITLYYPKMIVRDSANVENFYRWNFFNGKSRITSPESITIQRDRFFDGNLVPNTFDEFSYQNGDSIIVNLQSITQPTYDFLFLLKSQIASLGTSSISTPAVVDGNVKNITDPSVKVLGYFGTVSISADTIIAQ